VGDAIEIHKQRLAGNVSLKPRTKDYFAQRITALLKSWPELKKKEVRSITKTDCLNWAAKFGAGRSAAAFNHTISILRNLFEIGIEMGLRYDNPARSIKRLSGRPKQPALPEPGIFTGFVAAVENDDGGVPPFLAERKHEDVPLSHGVPFFPGLWARNRGSLGQTIFLLNFRTAVSVGKKVRRTDGNRLDFRNFLQNEPLPSLDDIDRFTPVGFFHQAAQIRFGVAQREQLRLQIDLWPSETGAAGNFHRLNPG